jgi:hypothetical protein
MIRCMIEEQYSDWDAQMEKVSVCGSVLVA